MFAIYIGQQVYLLFFLIPLSDNLENQFSGSFNYFTDTCRGQFLCCSFASKSVMGAIYLTVAWNTDGQVPHPSPLSHALPPSFAVHIPATISFQFLGVDGTVAYEHRRLQGFGVVSIRSEAEEGSPHRGRSSAQSSR